MSSVRLWAALYLRVAQLFLHARCLVIATPHSRAHLLPNCHLCPSFCLPTPRTLPVPPPRRRLLHVLHHRGLAVCALAGADQAPRRERSPRKRGALLERRARDQPRPPVYLPSSRAPPPAQLHTPTSPAQKGAENKTFVFLAAWTIGLWTIFPIVFVLEKQRAISHDQGAIIQVTLDILAKVRTCACAGTRCWGARSPSVHMALLHAHKRRRSWGARANLGNPAHTRTPHPRHVQVVFGVVLMGYRELMEGHHSGLVTFTVAMVGIEPHEVRGEWYARGRGRAGRHRRRRTARRRCGAAHNGTGSPRLAHRGWLHHPPP